MAMMHSVDAPDAGGVKAIYHCATLLNNWEEERKTFANAVPAATTAAPTRVTAGGGGGTTTHKRANGGGVGAMEHKGPTTYVASYVPYSAEAVVSAKPPGCFCEEAPRALLMYHGDVAAPVTYQRTLQELCYVPPTQPPYTHDETLDLPGVSTRQRRTRALAYSMGLTSTGTRSGRDDGDAATTGANLSLIDKEATLLRSMRDGECGGASTSGSRGGAGSTGEARSGTTAGGAPLYEPPALPPIGRVMQRDALLSTKQVTIDATGEYARTHLHVYPRTSSVCIGAHMASMNNVMHKTRLRVDDYAECYADQS